MAQDLRIPFAVAIAEPSLLKPWTAELSSAQLAILKIMYGCPLDGVARDERGWTELDYYWATQGFAEYDDLGYLTAVTPPLGGAYVPEEFPEAWACCGVRAGKTDRFAATIVVYEATCGGHEAFIRPGRPAICFQIAQDLRMAKYSLHSILATLKTMPAVGRDKLIVNVTADRIDLRNGVTIMVTPPTVKSIRGFDSPVAVCDEVGIWYQEADSANPDFEIYNQVSSRQATFAYPKIVGISSPWNRGGLLWSRAEAGTNGAKLRCLDCRKEGLRPGCEACARERRRHRGRLFLHATTASLGNPHIRRAWLEAERDKDPKAFERECLARFQDSLSGFLSPTLLEAAVDSGTLERAPAPLNFYVAAIDPAFRHDAFGFCIGHADGEQVVIDVVRQIKAVPGATLNPKEVMAEIIPILRQFRVRCVLTDQYHFASLAQLSQEMGVSLQEFKFTGTAKSSLYGNLQQLVNQRRIRFVDYPELLKELKSLERRLTHGGLVRVAAPEGMFDDLATVCALVAHGVTWMLPMQVPPPDPEPTLHQRCQDTIERRRVVDLETQDWSWLEERVG